MIKKISQLFLFNHKIALEDQNSQLTFYDLFLLSKTLPKELNKNCLVLLITENKILLYAVYLILLTFNCKIIILSNEDKNIENIIKSFRPKFIINSNLEIKNYEYILKFKKKINIYKSKSLTKYPINKSIKVLLSTSGTTSDPKFVKLTESNLIHNAKGIINSLKIDKTSFPITTLPLSYSYGLSILHSHVFSGNKVFINNLNIFNNKFWQLIKKHNITTFGGVPIFYDMLLRSKFNNKNKLPLRYLTQAGGAINKNTLNELKYILDKKNIKFFLMYGQTEATARISVKSLGNDNEITIGRPIKGTEIFIGNKPLNTIKNEFTGEIRIKSKSVFNGYANNYKNLKNLKKIKILHTGDIGLYKPHIGIQIVGRTKRITKIYGKRINLDSVEKLFSKLRKKVLVKSDNKQLFIYSLESKLEDLHKILKSNFFNIPYKIVKIRKIPLKPNGKVDYSKL